MNADLVVVVTDADGNAKTLSSEASQPGDRPRGIQFSSQLGSGFYTASFSLSRAIDAEHSDLHLGDDVRIVGTDGETAWEGWISGLPRSMDDSGHTLSVNCSGYMAYTADEPFSMVFVDRDMSHWGASSTTRKVNLLIGDLAPQDPSTSTAVSTGKPAIRLEINGAWTTVRPIPVTMYDAGAGNRVAKVYYDYDLSQSGGAWEFVLQVRDSDDQTGAVNLSTANLAAAATGTGMFTPATPARWAEWWYYYDAAGGADGAQFVAQLRDLAVYGDHGLPLIGDDPKGVAASDVIRYVFGRYCPHLSTAGVQDTTYPISHLTFEDATVNDVLLKVNSYHLWDWAVWENRTLHYKQTDLTDWDIAVRHDDVGMQIGLQGDEFADLRNGLIVKFTDVATGAADVLHPDDYPELRDDSIDNPATLHGRRKYGPDTFTIPFPTTAANALELGRIKLAEALQVKAPGSFTVTGRVRDRSGQPIAPWKVRSGMRVRLTSSATLSDRPRLVHEASYDHSSRSVTISVDATQRSVESFLDRASTALAAAGLG